MSSRLDVTAGFADVNDGRLYFETAGDGESIVFVHAGIADHRLWNAQFPEFAQDHLVTRYDMRGYGSSSVPVGEYSHTRDLTALLSVLGIRQTVLVGCSMGGQYCMDFAASYPHMVKGLVMVCAVPSGIELDEYPDDPPQAADTEAALKAGDLERASELLVQIFVDGTGRTPDQVDPTVRQLVHEMNLIALRNATANNAENTLLNPSVGENLESFSVPTLAIVGQYDEQISHIVADVMVERMPNAQKVVIKDAAHVPSLEQPDTFNAALRKWLKTLD